MDPIVKLVIIAAIIIAIIGGFIASKLISISADRDKILDKNGEETKVLKVFPQGLREKYKITFLPL